MGAKRGRASAGRLRPTVRRLLVFTEGRATEPDYIKHWYRMHRDRVLVALDSFHGTPMSLVERAVARKRSDLREERRGRGDAWDEYWCVFDRDEHPYLAEAFSEAASNGISVAFSNPCIELWLMLHFDDRRSHIERSDAKRESRRLLQCEGHLTPGALAQLTERFDVARARAQALERKHQLDGSEPRSNPSSNVWALVERLAREL